VNDATNDPDAAFQPLPDMNPDLRIQSMTRVIQDLAENRLGLQMDLTLLKEQYELQAEELEHFKNLATPEQRQMYRIIKLN
jgi:hypothetical protein